MPEIISTVVICAVLACAVFFSVRKLWRDKKNGRTCCGGGCDCCCGCGDDKKEKRGTKKH